MLLMSIIIEFLAIEHL